MLHLPLKNQTYLLVEDEYYAASDLVVWLENLGARVLGPISHLEHGMEVCRGLQNVDAAILDVNLQGQTVFPLVRELLEMNVAVLFVSGHGRAFIPQRYRALPHFDKPPNMKSLLDHLIKLAEARANDAAP